MNLQLAVSNAAGVEEAQGITSLVGRYVGGGLEIGFDPTTVAECVVSTVRFA